MDPTPVTCPHCFETFSIIAPPADECPCQLDYDCEICCRPMLISCAKDGYAEASSLDDLS
ncbi:CPXCG motif-containing cysteine-rich protein [Persicirhabdus sediminis]|uniref:Cysteine-rich CPXCG n=1 Tax=Persicirhabdus sediminis TaxID=454144 RepID=A0A8J7MGE2_9BACT|nr:CPXCG motif-containing cysteine-rich protein [Persicirhabdus sediminis]MBK1792367.1 hypothetical protein [Persicirhabdus sediminis]